MSKTKPPEENALDKTMNVVRAVVDTLPGAAIASTLLFQFIKLPYQKRTEKWQQDVSDALEHIQKNGFDLENLKENEEFIDILLQIVPTGIKNHQEEKRKALKNALIHSVEEHAPEFSIQQTFISCIDSFTVWHIKTLLIFSNPENWFKQNSRGFPGMGSIGSVRGTLESAYPELKSKKEFVDLIWTDLYNKGFLSIDKAQLQTTMTSSGALDKRTTTLGEQFIQFISD